MARAEDAVLEFLQSNEEIPDSHQFATSLGLLHGELENVIKSLHGFQLVVAQVFQSISVYVSALSLVWYVLCGCLVTVRIMEQDIKKESWVLTEEGEAYASSGSPEAQLFLGVPPEGISTDELKVDGSSVAFYRSLCFRRL